MYIQGPVEKSLTGRILPGKDPCRHDIQDAGIAFLLANGIKMSGPKLGRPSKDRDSGQEFYSLIKNNPLFNHSSVRERTSFDSLLLRAAMAIIR